MKIPLSALALPAVLLPCVAAAVDSTMTSGGFSGYGITPTAHVLGWGLADLAYDRQLPGARDPSGHNFVAGFGLLPNLEVSGRIAANSPLGSNCFVEGCGIRDLSASLKLGIGLDAARHFHVAAGAADIGGAATNFRTYYGVLTWTPNETIEMSGGLARRSTARLNQSPLDGGFASAAWQPLPWVRGHVEYTDGNAWAGVRLFAPESWLPEGWKANVGVNTRLTNTSATQRAWVSAGLTIPLYKVPSGPGARAPLPPVPAGMQRLPAYEARMAPPVAPAPPASAIAQAPAPATGASVAPSLPAAPAPAPAAPPDTSDAALERLAAELRRRGLEDIWTGRMPDGSVAVQANNATYNWNALDALGVALGAVARTHGDSRTPYRLVLTQRQVPLVAVTGQADCLRQWIEQQEPPCPAGELSTPGTLAVPALLEGAQWVVRGLQPSWRTLRVGVSPVLRTHIATEVGTLDYSAGARVAFGLPLWAGASVDWHVQGEFARSGDYAPGGVFAPERIRGGTERLSFTQTLRLPLERWFGGNDLAVRNRGLAAVTGQASIGRFGNHFDGVDGALRWEPGEGRHRVTAQAAWLHNASYGLIPGEPRNAVPLLLSYRYNLAATRSYLEATAGQFMYNDRGLQLALRQWFGDVAVQVFVRRTTLQPDGARNMAGIELSVPLGPRRDMDPGLFQITGTPRFSHTVQTVVGGGVNFATSYRGTLPPTPSLDAVYNSDRAGLLYFEDNIRRIRDAARW